jgi:hypothetical protein
LECSLSAQFRDVIDACTGRVPQRLVHRVRDSRAPQRGSREHGENVGAAEYRNKINRNAGTSLKDKVEFSL